MEEADGKYLSRGVIAGLMTVIALILVGWALKATYVVTMPFAFAFFLAVVVRPIERRVGAAMPAKLRWVGVVAAMAAIVAAFVLFIGLIWIALDLAGDEAPQYIERASRFRESANAWARRNNLPVWQATEGAGGVGARLAEIVLAFFGSLWTIAALLVLVFFFTLLMLVEWDDANGRIRRAFGRKNTTTTAEAMDVYARKIRRYILVRIAISAVSGVTEGAWLWANGVDFAVLWGVLFFLLNFIPHIGSLIAGIPPTIVAAVQLGVGRAALAIGGLLIIEQAIGNFLDPRLEGRALRLSPTGILLSLIYWGWTWGAVGAVLAVPLTAAIAVACASVERLRPVAYLLSRNADETIVEEVMAANRRR